MRLLKLKWEQGAWYDSCVASESVINLREKSRAPAPQLFQHGHGPQTQGCGSVECFVLVFALPLPHNFAWLSRLLSPHSSAVPWPQE